MGVEIRFVRRHRSVTAAVQVDAPASKPDLALHNTIVRAGAHHAFTELEPRLARLIEPVLRDAGDRAAKEFTRLSNRSMVAAAYRQADRLRIGGMGSEQARTLLRSLSLTSAAPPDLKVNSTMICVKPTPEQAKAVGGDENTHVTLVYLGEYDGDLNRLAEILGPVAASHAPLNGEVAGDGEFGPLVQILLPDVPGLVELRVAVTEALMDGGQTYATEHGYLSHMTREYLPGAYPPEVNFRVALAATLPHCGTCSYWEGRGFCAMFGADARLDNVCDEWTQVPPPAVPFGAPLDFADLLIVRGDTEIVALPLVGSPPLTASAVATRSTQSAQTAAEAQAAQSAQEAAAQAAAAALQDALSEEQEAQRLVEVARKSGDPEKVVTAERTLKIANQKVQRALQAVSNPEQPPEPPEEQNPVTPPIAPVPAPPSPIPITSPIQTPTTIKGQVAPPTDLPSAIQTSTQNKTQDILTNVPDAPEAAKNPAIGGTLADIEKGIEEAGFVARPTTEALERIEEVKKLPPQFQIPAGDELLDTRALAAQVRGVTDPVRQAVVRQVGEPIVQGVGLQWDEANPFSAKVLAQSASQITSISETTQANVMQIIQDAHDNGWSVPVTAKAIQQGMRDASPERATLIARTELAGAVNGGSLAATQIVQSATGVQYAKVWTTAPGARYPRHENYPDLNGQVQNSLDGTFQVGDAQLRYPGDPDGPPEEVCNCRCTLIYQEVDDSAAPEAAPEGTPTPTAEAAPAATMPTIQTSDPAYAAQALANGDRVVLNQPNELSTFIDDLGAKAAAAQAAGEAAPTLDLGDVTVKGTNLFTQDSLGIPRIDMPQLSGTPLPGSLATTLPKIPGGYEGDPNQVNIGPLFYQSLRDRGVKVTEEDVLASHLKPTQDQINGGKVAKVMDGLENGTMTERRIPISSDNYIVDGHHQWAATIGADWKTGTDAGLTIPVDRIDEPITTILDQANAFAKKYGIPQQSVNVPPVKPDEVAKLDQPIPQPASSALTAPVTPKDPILGITPFRAGEDNPLGFYDTAKAKQFEADLKTEAVADHLTIQSSDHVTGVWQGVQEPSYSVHVLGDQSDVATFAEHMRAKYDQDGVMVFTPEADMPKGMEVNAAEFTITGGEGVTGTVRTDTQKMVDALDRHGFQGATVIGDKVVIVGEPGEEDGQKAIALASDVGGQLTFKQGHVEFVDRPAGENAIGVLKAPDPSVEIGVADEPNPDNKLPQNVYEQQDAQADAFLKKDLPHQDEQYDDEILEDNENKGFAKQQIADDISARLKDNPAWQAAALKESDLVPVADVKVGDIVAPPTNYTTPNTAKVTEVVDLGPQYNREMGYSLSTDRQFRLPRLFGLPRPDEEAIQQAAPGTTEDTEFKVTNVREDPATGEQFYEAEVVDPGGKSGPKVGTKITVNDKTPIDLRTKDDLLGLKGVWLKPPPGYHSGDLWYPNGFAATASIERYPADGAFPMPQGKGGANDQSLSARSVSGLVDTWAGTSADQSPWSLAMQRAVHEEFGIDDSAVQFLAERDPDAWKDADALYAEKGPALRAFVRAQYDNTQQALADAGIHDVMLYRGFSLSDLDPVAKAAIPVGAHADTVALQPASSFSSDYLTAKNFTGGDSAIVAASVPASRILGTSRTGLGALNEREFVVMAGAEGAPADQAYVYRFERGYGSAPSNVNAFWSSGVTHGPLGEPMMASKAELVPGDIIHLPGAAVDKPLTVTKIEDGKLWVKDPNGDETWYSTDHTTVVKEAPGAAPKPTANGKWADVGGTVTPGDLKVGDTVKLDADTLATLKNVNLVAPQTTADSVFKVSAADGNSAAITLVDGPGWDGETALVHGDQVQPVAAVTEANAPVAPAPAPESGKWLPANGPAVQDLKPGDQFSMEDPDGPHGTSQAPTIYEATGQPSVDGKTSVKIVHDVETSLIGETTDINSAFQVPYVKYAPPPPPPEKTLSTKWTYGGPVLYDQLNIGDTFKAPNLTTIFKYIGKDDKGVPLMESVDPNGTSVKIGAVVPIPTSSLLLPATAELSTAKPKVPVKWKQGKVATDVKPGDLVTITAKGWMQYMKETPGGVDPGNALFVVTNKPDATGHVQATVADPGKSKLNVGETYLVPSDGLSYIETKGGDKI